MNTPPTAPTLGPTFRRVKPSTLSKKPGKGVNFVDKLERATNVAANTIVKHQQALSKEIGERQFGKQKISERQQVRRYMLIRDDENAWANIIQSHGLKAAIDYAQTMERLLKKYPEEESYLSPGVDERYVNATAGS